MSCRPSLNEHAVPRPFAPLHSLDNARILVNANKIASALKYVTISVNAFAFFMKISRSEGAEQSRAELRPHNKRG